MLSAYQSALSGLRAFDTKIQVGSNNIANSNTESFKRSRVTLNNVEPQGVKASVSRVETTGSMVYEETADGQQWVELSNVDLAQEIPEIITSSELYKANLKTIETVNEMTGELLNIKS
jgi:flagellar hook protein FlgE